MDAIVGAFDRQHGQCTDVDAALAGAREEVMSAWRTAPELGLDEPTMRRQLRSEI